MSIKINIIEKTLHFKKPARTSRGAYSEHRMVLVTMTEDDGRFGLGECAPLPDLSCDAHAYDNLGEVARLIDKAINSDSYADVLRPYPALLFNLLFVEQQAFSFFSRLPQVDPCFFLRQFSGSVRTPVRAFRPFFAQEVT